MTPVYLSLGSNIGDRQETITTAVAMISQLAGVRLWDLSSFYATEPVGYLDQPEFINCAIRINTELSPEKLLNKLQSIELYLGRTERERWREREIDIDILLYDDQVIITHDLLIPHPEMINRRFVLEPLAEIAPDVVHPVAGKTIAQLLEECGDTSRVSRVADGRE